MATERSEYTGCEVVAEIPSVDLYTSDQDKVGRVLEIGPEWVIVDRDGLFDGGNLWIPANRVTGDPQQGSLYVDCTKDEIGDMGWDQEPTTDDYTNRDRSYSDATADATAGGYTETQSQGSYDTDTRGSFGTTGTDRGTDAERIQVHEEELEARKVAQEAGAVNVSKNVVEEQRELDVPVMREEVQVTRHAVSGDASPDGTAFQDTGDTIRVPIVEERVEVRKVPHVVEEIEISKRQVQETQHVSDTVRREEVNVQEEGTTSSRTGSTGEFESTEGTSGSSTGMGTVGQNRQDSNF